MGQTITLVALSIHMGFDSGNRMTRYIAALCEQKGVEPFPDPIEKSQGGQILTYDFDEAMAWFDKYYSRRAYQFNRLAQRFIRGEYDRPELQ